MNAVNIFTALISLSALTVCFTTRASAQSAEASRKVVEVIVEQAAPLKSGPLDGNTYCRTYHANGGMGQPHGEVQHCLEFAGGKMVDSANTAFGRPPEAYDYSVTGNIVVTGHGTYELSNDQKTLTSKAGASTRSGTVFQLQ